MIIIFIKILVNPYLQLLSQHFIYRSYKNARPKRVRRLTFVRGVCNSNAVTRVRVNRPVGVIVIAVRRTNCTHMRDRYCISFKRAYV